MSGLAGILRFDGVPVDPAALDSMTATMAHRGPDGQVRWIDGPIGMAHLLLRTTREAAEERQPVTDADGVVCLVLDGRIDNRTELRADLGRDAQRLRDGSDPELLLTAYLRWGPATLARVVGELALAVWDGRRGELVLARDFLGKRPLLYHRGGHALRWASEVQAVLADPAVPRRPNVAMVGERLSLRPRSTTETLYEGVERVPPAHLLVITDGRVQVQRHWDWDRAPVARRSATDHVAELLDTCCDAVEACLDAPGPVAAELSGGVDSSSVVALADRVVRDGRAASPLELLALVFPGAPHDETQHIRAVAQHVGRPVAELQPTPAGTDHYLTQITRFLDLPESPIVAMRRSLHALARERGARVLLTGEGGDEWFTGSPLVLADAFRTGRPGAAWRTARAERGIWDSRGFAHQLWRDGVRPLLPERMHRWEDRLRHRPVLPAWLPLAFWSDVGLPDRVRSERLQGPGLARAAVARGLGQAGSVQVTEVADRTLALAGLEARAPLEDRRVVELALALPEELRRKGHTTKWALREAMAGMVPDSVRSRLDKASFTPVLYAELATQGGGTLFRDLALSDLGWVDAAVVQGLWADLEADHRTGSGHPHVWPLWTILSTERWVRAIF